MDLWQELPFSDPVPLPSTSSSSWQPSSGSSKQLDEAAGTSEDQVEDGASRESTPAKPIESALSLDHFTYRDYQILPCDYVIRPADMLLFSSLDSHSDYQGFMETMPMNHPPAPRHLAHPSLSSDDPEEEDEHVKMAKRVGLLQHLPTGSYDGCRKNRECVICMNEFNLGDAVRYLPCMHTYHAECINSWLMRSFTCPSCMEPVDAALLSSYETN